MQSIDQAIATIKAGRHLTREQCYEVFSLIMTGRCEPGLMADFLTCLAHKGESIEEIVGATDVMHEHVTRVPCDADAMDTCGTGGDGINTYNVSTAAAIIAAAAGAVVAKHGNHSHTRVSGSAQAAACLGITLEAPVPVLQQCLASCRIAFLHAPLLHPAMRHAAPVRKQLGIRTIFNIVGPLTNPAGVKRQLLGVFKPDLTEKLGQVLIARGATHAWVVHAECGLCDLSITGTSRVTEVRDGRMRTFAIHPNEYGLRVAPLESLLIDSPASSAAAIRAILDGVDTGPRYDHALLNAGGALVVAGVAEDLAEGIALSRKAIASGQAAETLRRLCELSSGRGLNAQG
ncbi:MAG TPA: anthranilate phosphoribosyltransferase [Phycisphaerae bacterium]|jgi:anthranilate phosphoribosyltransferase|nr:anthranilate phosphoribosyltransferase [Phycisphaerae bacterium]HOB75580.1 anthranilate phosphoribosyltransferase [Phycisphaerae bacterium]HOJ55150.1 anthranilate phosphoribosyltransferase [Phycisphaerae bacterium]HOL27352.1 anthranilate phosphoribosyltransferase [Phycisphaerae bacterium]HPP20708.1 anthranilate phosphoribosyltransferase [Phycisphaerae bacterium]